MSYQARRELLARVAPRYREATRREKAGILDEFIASTGYARKYAIKLLREPVRPLRPIQRARPRAYGAEVQQALVVAWSAANGICGKRLAPFLPELVPSLERHGHLTLSTEARSQLLAISAATVDRLLRPLREQGRPRGIATTKPGRLLKHQIPIRTFTDWNDAKPGFLEADLVAHCGGNPEGAFLHTLVLTDIATGWTECLPLLFRTQDSVVHALKRARQMLPFPLLGLDTDNGSEFLNRQVLEYCQAEQITFTRGRAHKKNDQCFVEQKNGVVVRQFVGYDRFEGQRAYEQFTELYRAVRLYVNFFQPSMKLRSKKRDGAKVSRQYDSAQTPLQRLLAAKVCSAAAEAQLQTFAEALDPVRLLRQLQCLQDAVWRHAHAEISSTPASERQVFNHAKIIGAIPEMPAVHEITSAEARVDSRRKYRRSGKPRVPHTWRTRPDPFEEVWGELAGWLADEPERTAKSLFSQLQTLYPDRFPNGQLRTLQRRVKVWRAQTILSFDDGWLREDLQAGAILPGPLRGESRVHQPVPTPSNDQSAAESMTESKTTSLPQQVMKNEPIR